MTIKTSLHELGMFFFFLLIAMVIFSSAAYYAEAGEKVWLIITRRLCYCKDDRAMRFCSDRLCECA